MMELRYVGNRYEVNDSCSEYRTSIRHDMNRNSIKDICT